MATKKNRSGPGRDEVSSVDEYLTALEHPHKKEIQALRKVILGLDTRILEEVKWNAPSFRLMDHFATFRLHPVPMFQLVLHTGAKKGSPKQFRLDDPSGLVKWAAKDRCTISFESNADALAKRDTVTGIIKDWIAQL